MSHYIINEQLMKKSIYKILIVDDEEDLCEILQFNLQGEGYQADVAYSAEEALELDLTQYHLILLDVMMGQMSGFRFADKVRKEMGITVPIIFVTARTTENDLLTGFNLGGDDYITKPFSIKEVVARVKAVIARTGNEGVIVPEVFRFEGLTLDQERRVLLVDDDDADLTRKEFEIIKLLIENVNRIYTRDEILDRVWSDEVVVSSRTIDVHVARLRKKAGVYGVHIKSKPGYGYYFDAK